MMSEELFGQMRQSVIDGDAAAAAALAEQALANGIPPVDAIDRGFVPGLTLVGEQFGAGDLFLPDMMLAARAMQKAVAVLEPEMKRQATERQLEELQSELARLSRLTAMGEMASTLAHEINQPLSAIANYLQGCSRLTEGIEIGPCNSVGTGPVAPGSWPGRPKSRILTGFDGSLRS